MCAPTSFSSKTSLNVGLCPFLLLNLVLYATAVKFQAHT